MRKFILSCLFAGSMLAGGAMAAEVIISVAPPRPIIERRVIAPGRGYVWVAGFHRWDGRAYIWVPGHWVVPPRPRARWVEGRYIHRGHGWVYREGYWR